LATIQDQAELDNINRKISVVSKQAKLHYFDFFCEHPRKLSEWASEEFNTSHKTHNLAISGTSFTGNIVQPSVIIYKALKNKMVCLQHAGWPKKSKLLPLNDQKIVLNRIKACQ